MNQVTLINKYFPTGPRNQWVLCPEHDRMYPPAAGCWCCKRDMMVEETDWFSTHRTTVRSRQDEEK